MKISQATQDIILELNEFSGSKLKNIPDLTIIIEIAENSVDKKLLDELIFSAKYVNGLAKILQSSTALNPGKNGSDITVSQEEAREKIKKEFHANILKFTGLFREFIRDTEENIRTEFEKKYLSLTQSSMLNLNSLIYDLSWLKKYYNNKRR